MTSDNGLTLRGLTGEWLSYGQGKRVFGELMVLNDESLQPTFYKSPDNWACPRGDRQGIESRVEQGYGIGEPVAPARRVSSTDKVPDMWTCPRGKDKRWNCTMDRGINSKSKPG